MMIALHKQARTTPAVRAEIAASLEPVSVLARRHNITEATVRKWRARSEFQDRPPRVRHYPAIFRGISQPIPCGT
jgi:hypothetical protein